MASSASAKSKKPLSHSNTITRRSSISPGQFTQSPPTIASDPAALSTSSPPASQRSSASNGSMKYNGTGTSASGGGGGGGGGGFGIGIGGGGGASSFRPSRKTAKWVQIVFSVAGALIFAGLWIYMLAKVNCHTNLSSITQPTIEAFAIGGSICCLFVLCHSCLDQTLAIGRGVFGCIIFFLIAIMTFGNILIGFLAVNCACVCYPSSNAFKENQFEDLVIFATSIAGAFCLIIILLVASVAL